VSGPSRAAALAVGAALLGLAATDLFRDRPPREPATPGRARLAPPAGASCRADELEPAGVRIRGPEASARLARGALVRLLATETGARAREILRSGALPDPLTIELNERGDNFTPYRVPGGRLAETILFDPTELPLVETEQGRLPATPETILAHELGHAVFKLRAEEDVLREVENPVRRELGLPERSRF
jgi:hypothetical protein